MFLSGFEERWSCPFGLFKRPSRQHLKMDEKHFPDSYPSRFLANLPPLSSGSVTRQKGLQGLHSGLATPREPLSSPPQKELEPTRAHTATHAQRNEIRLSKTLQLGPQTGCRLQAQLRGSWGLAGTLRTRSQGRRPLGHSLVTEHMHSCVRLLNCEAVLVSTLTFRPTEGREYCILFPPREKTNRGGKIGTP